MTSPTGPTGHRLRRPLGFPVVAAPGVVLAIIHLDPDAKVNTFDPHVPPRFLAILGEESHSERVLLFGFLPISATPPAPSIILAAQQSLGQEGSVLDRSIIIMPFARIPAHLHAHPEVVHNL